MKLILIFLTFTVVTATGQVTSTSIAWHQNVKEITYKIDKHNIERTEFDSLGKRIIDIEYHPVLHPPDEIGHGYDSTVYIYSEKLKTSTRYFNWYDQSFKEEKIYHYHFKGYDSIVSCDKNDSINSTQIKTFLESDTLIGNINNKGYAVDTFYYYLQDERIISHNVVWNQKNGKTVYYTNIIKYNKKGNVIYEADSFKTTSKYFYDRKGHLKKIIRKKPASDKDGKLIKERTNVSYLYF